MTHSCRRCAVAACTLALAFLAAPASAYIDPGTGSYIFQMVAALLISAAFAIKTFWARIRHRISALGRKHDGDGKPLR